MKRIIGVWIPYWIVNICVIQLKAYDGVLDVIFDLTLISPNFGLGWYLNYLLLWYVVFWTLHRFTCDNRLRLIVMGIITIALMVYYGFKSEIRFEQSFAFPLGVLMANYEDKSKRFFKRGQLLRCWLLELSFWD